MKKGRLRDQMMEAYCQWFSPRIEKALAEIRASKGAGLLSPEALQGIRETAERRIGLAARDWFDGRLAELCAEENPLLQFDTSLMTPEEARRAAPVLLRKLKNQEIILPQRLESTAGILLDNWTAYLREVLFDLSAFRKEICAAVLGGREYTAVTGMRKAGDAHNKGKSTLIVETDAGKLVYKPHSCRIDTAAASLVREHFDDILRVPEVFACGDRFGIAEYLEKQRAEGREAAARYYRSLGGAAAVLRMLGSKDMHMENLFACGGKIALIDLETLLYPVPVLRRDPAERIFSEEDMRALFNTLLYSELVNTRIRGPRDEAEFSPLMNTGEEGSAPLVDGERQNVVPFEKEFFDGFSALYDRILQLRPALKEELPARFSGIVLRNIPASTRMYSGVIRRLNSRYAYESEDYYRTQRGKLRHVLSRDKAVYSRPVEDAEEAAVLEGDIPYFQTFADSRDLYRGGEVIEKGFFLQSALDRALEILDNMSAREKELEIRFLRLSIAGAKMADESPTLPEPVEMPGKDAPVLPRAQALEEAEWILDRILERSLTLQTGTTFWLSFDPGKDNPEVMQAGLYTGTAGLAVFFAAMEKAAKAPETRRKAAAALDACLRLLEQYTQSLCAMETAPAPEQFPLGEGSGAAGVLRGLVLVNRFREGACLPLIRSLCGILKKTDFRTYDETDKASGIAGLITTLCRYEELYTQESIQPVIAALCDRLKALQTLAWENGRVWQTLKDHSHPISGAVHGMAGIAEAFFLAGLRLGTDAYRACAEDALRFEDKAYSEKLRGWEDRRVPGNHVLSRGNCYGAPGMGIIFRRLQDAGISHPVLDRNIARAARTVENSGLLPLDHLCCGNMSIVDYDLETGRQAEAGRLLAKVVRGRKENGSYRLGYVRCRSNENVTLFYGFAGIGYELLRYTDSAAFPTVL